MKKWIDELKSASVWEVATNLGLKKTRGNGVSPCPSCGVITRGSTDKRGPVGVNGEGTGWRCFKCDVSGDALQLAAYALEGKTLANCGAEAKKRISQKFQKWGMVGAIENKGGGYRISKVVQTQKQKRDRYAPKPYINPKYKWHKDILPVCESALWGSDGALVLSYLQSRGFREETLKAWYIGALIIKNNDGKIVEQFVAIPVLDKDGKCVNMRFRSVPGDCLYCDGAGCRRCHQVGEVKKIYLRCPGRPTTLFGVKQLKEDKSDDVYICEGELDVIALWQLGVKDNVVSGTGGAGTWDDEWLDILEPYRHFVIVYDTDAAGEKGAKGVADKLGRDRCSRAKLPEKDPAECMEKGHSPKRIMIALDNAQPLLEAGLVRVDAYAMEVERLVSSPQNHKGLSIGSQKMEEALGGWRPELVVVTGDTAAGKTSFVTWLALEQARRGVGVLLTSFEQRPIGTVQKLLRAEVGGDFTEVDQATRANAMATLGSLPIYMVDHYGELATDQMRDLLSYSSRRRDVRFAVVDHLGFMVQNADDERKAIEAVVRDYATLSVHLGMTIVLICHPNNMSIAQQRRVKLGDLKGASAIRQDAHTGIVVERILPGKTVEHPAAAVHIDKCRSEFGLQGARLTLFYDPQACVYGDTWEETPAGRAMSYQHVP